MAANTLAALRRWSDGGALPVVVDATSCTQGLLGLEAGEREVIDAGRWCAELSLPRLEVRRRVPRAVVHPTCASRQLGLNEELATLAGALAAEGDVPAAATG